MDLGVAAASPALAALQTLASTSTGASTTATVEPTASHAAVSQTPSVHTSLSGGGLYALSQGISQGLSAADAAGAAGHGVLDLLRQMQQAATQATDPNTSSAERQALSQGFQAAAAQISPTLQTASIGGVNLVDGSQSGSLKVALGEGATASLSSLDLRTQGPLLDLQGHTLDDADSASAASQATASALGAASGALAGLQTQADGLAAHAGFLQAAGQSAAIPGLDDGGDSARLLALQASQQLSLQSSSIANTAPQQILALFKG